MPDQPEKGGVLEVTCPCCEARLTVDPVSGAVLGSEKAANARAGVDLKDARQVLEQETARIHEGRIALCARVDTGEQERLAIEAMNASGGDAVRAEEGEL